jgi:hypothetical protein
LIIATDQRMRSPRARSRRVLRGVILGLVALGVLYGFDGSRQPMSGSGWQLLGYVRASSSSQAILAIPDQATLATQWKELYLHDSPPPVDWSAVVVYRFTAIGSIACPSRLDGIDFDQHARRVTPRFSRAITLGCDPTRVVDAFIVALDRDRLLPGSTVVNVDE